MAGFVRTDDQQKNKRALCMKGADDRERSHYFIGAVKYFISYHHSDMQTKDLCASLEPSLQPICLSTTTDYCEAF